MGCECLMNELQVRPVARAAQSRDLREHQLEILEQSVKRWIASGLRIEKQMSLGEEHRCLRRNPSIGLRAGAIARQGREQRSGLREITAHVRPAARIRELRGELRNVGIDGIVNAHARIDRRCCTLRV